MRATIYHFPPELIALLIDTIPLLNRSKPDVISFFRGAGVAENTLYDVAQAVKENPKLISKYEIARTILTRLNEKGDGALSERREILKRIIEFESFEVCWDNDRLKAIGLVSEIRRIVNTKDSFSRMKAEKERIEKQKRDEYLLKVQKAREITLAKNKFKDEINKLLLMQDRQMRGKLFEQVMNNLFKASGILMSEAFTLNGDNKEGITEQIDGVIEIDNEYYLVEMKWWGQSVGTDEIARHLVRIFSRNQARGIFIAVNGFTQPAITMSKESLNLAVSILCDLQEIIRLLETEGDIKHFFKKKIEAAIIYKNPYFNTLTNEY
ncbi:restriction endonuclease [Paenibacillus sp. LK1]|uniref:restriction endonuclease n=1 Tax=Paenibacillus sp. LK1 TaxID=2053014 RepID=UPI000C19BF3E|nr:restriction endonuclease [Paenibacillus sp. LK1]PIH57521.1 restriction endonuclease [Paenibacillus sp. LK1]